MQTLELTQKLLTYETDAYGLWRPDAIFRLMQEIAGAHSASLGLSRDALLDMHLVWMIARVHLKVLAYPRLHDEVRAFTWYGPPGRITYPRYIEITGAHNLPIAVISTSWVVVDTKTRHILLPDKAGLAFPPAANLAPPLPEPTKMRLLKTGDAFVTCRAPQYSDLDLNGHMNNASYVSWILDLFPMSWHCTHRIQSIFVSYSTEATPGELVEMTLYRNDTSFEVLGADKVDGHVVFEAQGVWMEYN